MRFLSLLLVLSLFIACGEEEEAAEAETEEAAATAAAAESGETGPSLDLQSIVGTKLYGFRKIPDRMMVKGRVAVGTYISAKKNKAGAHLLLELTVSPCAGCTPTSEEKMWKRQTTQLLKAKRLVDKEAILEMEKVKWTGSAGYGHYSLLFKAKKRGRAKSFQAEHAYAARFNDGHHLVELKVSPCDDKGHPFAKTREELVKAATKTSLKKTVRRAWAKLGKHFPPLGT